MNYLIGAGGHASVIEDIAKKNNFILDGVFYDGDIKNLTNLKKIDEIKNVLDYASGNNFIVAFGDIESRINLVENLEGKINWFTLIDPTAIISSNVKIGNGTVIMPGTVINSGVNIGNHVIINSGSIIEHGCDIGDHVHISPGSTICGNSKISFGAWIGANSVIINAIKIGKKAIIGAGSVVINDIDAETKIAGNPAKDINKK